jgi:hypothetical protein
MSMVVGFDVNSSVEGRYVKEAFSHVEIRGTSVQRWRRSWLTLIWCLWIIFAGGAAALVCMSHPATHNGAHPLLCLDASNPVAQTTDGSPLLVGGRKLRSPFKTLIAVAHSAALGTHSTLILDVPAQEFSWPREGILPSTPISFQPVLRL